MRWPRPDFEGAHSNNPYVVICDASLEGIGAVLSQNDRPLAYESRRLIVAKRNYTTGDVTAQ